MPLKQQIVSQGGEKLPMIGILWGEVHELSEENVLLKVGGTGYQLLVSANTLENLKKGDEVCIYTHLHVREDILQLFGFYTRDERELFLRLIDVSKIGPKVAMAVLSGFKVDALKDAIVSEDAASISRVPGVGKKTAERMVLELKDKIAPSLFRTESRKTDTQSPGMREAKDALIGLGYTLGEAQDALGMIETNGDAVDAPESLIKKALKILGSGNRKA